MKIALDLDGVLADLHSVMLDETIYNGSDFEDWDKPMMDRFMHEARRVWEDHWQDIDPVEPYLSQITDYLHRHHDVDIVTNTAGPDDVVEQWLDRHDIHHGRIVRPHQETVRKADLDYDVYVDDNPTMAGEVSVLYLRDRPWNQTERGTGPYLYHSYEESYLESEGTPDGQFTSDAPFVIRITSVADVGLDLGIDGGVRP